MYGYLSDCCPVSIADCLAAGHFDVQIAFLKPIQHDASRTYAASKVFKKPSICPLYRLEVFWILKQYITYRWIFSKNRLGKRAERHNFNLAV